MGGDVRGTLEAARLGADIRFGDWLAGVTAARTSSEADYAFDRSVDACGLPGVGEGSLTTDLDSLNPYVGRRTDSGWIWATLGIGHGDATLSRCDSGHRERGDLSMRMAAAGGRHEIAVGERRVWSLVEDVGVLDLRATGSGALGQAVSTGRVRFGIEVSGLADPSCDHTLSTYVRALARADWGDGDTGAGVDLAAGARYRNESRRLGLAAGVRGLAVHSAAGYRDYGADIAVSLLPKPDGTGMQFSLASSFGDGRPSLDNRVVGGNWLLLTRNASRRAAAGWRTELTVAYGTPAWRGLALPFLEWSPGDAAFGVRFDPDTRLDRMHFEVTVGRRGTVGNHLGFVCEVRF